MHPEEIMITLEHVMKRFGEDIVLKDVSHTFEKGKIHGIIGNMARERL